MEEHIADGFWKEDGMEAVIFDMDGVIFDSERLVLECWMEVAEKNHLEGIEEAMIACLGRNDADSEQIFLQRFGADFPYKELKKGVSKRFHEQSDGGKLPMKPGVVEILRFLKDEGWKTALASSTRIEVVTNELRDAGILPYFDVVIGGDMIKRSKPNPDIFLETAAKLGIDPHDAYIIEDSFNGIRAAHASGAKPLMVPDMVQPDREIRDLCYRVFSDLFETKTFLE